jgi:bifunctional aspartokinase / homoserine dehydrogenase 1
VLNAQDSTLGEASPLTVVKVGGALLGGGRDLALVADAIVARRRRGDRLLVVVSALKGVTDALEHATALALDPRSGNEMVRDALARLRRQHESVAADLPGRDAVLLRLQPVFDGIERLLTGIRLTGELTPRTRDLVMAHGERLSAPLLAAAILAAGADARSVTAEEAGLLAVGPFGMGACDVASSRTGLAALRHELFDRALVLTGFYGVNAGGDVVLFGRGGSDYTAGVVAAGLLAAGLELWKDVPGFMTADPREVPTARLVPELSFDEACELGLYGARILHPRCLDPLRGLPVTVSVRPVRAVDTIGTRVVERRTDRPTAPTALTARRGVALVRAQAASMVNEPGAAGRILATLGNAGINVDAVASSMTSLSCSIDQKDVGLARRALKGLESQATGGTQVSITDRVALLGLVGDGIGRGAAHEAALLGCLARLDVPVELLCRGPGDVGVSCVVPEARLQQALAALHATFFGADSAHGAPAGPAPASQAAASAG